MAITATLATPMTHMASCLITLDSRSSYNFPLWGRQTEGLGAGIILRPRSGPRGKGGQRQGHTNDLLGAEGASKPFWSACLVSWGTQSKPTVRCHLIATGAKWGSLWVPSAGHIHTGIQTTGKSERIPFIYHTQNGKTTKAENR